MYQGQYWDEETELAYNWFRYYSPDTGMYISQDPIGLAGNNPNFYAYVGDSNAWVDVLGLDCTKAKLKAEANSPDMKDPRFTKAGRSLTKHGAGKRAGNSAIPSPRGNPTAINKQAADLVDDIVENGSITTRTTAKGMNVTQIAKDDGVGMVFEDLGGNYNFKYFGENLF